jgi:PAS domain S-box-containing protein
MANPGTSDSKPVGHRAPAGDRHDQDQRPAPADVNFWAVFESAPDAYLLLAPDPPHFTMVAANDARLRATMTRREDIIGRPLFEVFPDNPGDPGATGVRNLQASLEEVIRTGKPHRMALQKYDIRTPAGEFEERYWEPLNAPVFDGPGTLIYIIHRVEDVTEQARADTRLRILESVVTTANDSVMVTEPLPLEGPGPRIVYVNEAFTRMTGYAPEEVIGQATEMLVGPETDPETIRRIRVALERREPVRAELLNYRRDGSPFWMEVSIAPVLDEQGAVVQWTSVQRDTTERREAEATALRFARERAARTEEARARREIETILESITDGFFAVDRDWRFTFVNHEAERLLQRSRGELIGRCVWDEFPAAVGARFEREYRRAAEVGTTVQFEAYFPPLEAWFDVRAYPTADGLSVFFRDVTARKHAEERLRDSEERYRLLADLIPQFIWTTDAKGYHGYFSRRWYDFTGATLAETEGDRWMRFLHPDDRERTISRWQHSLETGEPYSIEYRFRNVDGEYCWFWGQAMPQRDDAGAIVGWFGTLTDISERRRLDEERERLLAREREARAEAERRREELERVTESRTHLMRGFSHDVKNPLGAADGYAQLLEDGVLGELSRKQVESIQRIRRSIQTSLHLIHDLLELARAEAGQLEIESVPTDVAELAREAVEDFRAQATAAGLALEVCIDETLPTETDPARVRQILSNLLSNAVKYTPQGRITVDADLPADGRGRRDGDRIAIRVTDTGPGIPAEKQETIFQEFTRLDPEAHHGAGVGLAISRRIARLLDGDITVESEVGHGSTFTLWLPLEGVAASAGEPE